MTLYTDQTRNRQKYFDPEVRHHCGKGRLYLIVLSELKLIQNIYFRLIWRILSIVPLVRESVEGVFASLATKKIVKIRIYFLNIKNIK